MEDDLYLDPAASPNRATGVRRLNAVPIIIISAVLAGIGLLITWAISVKNTSGTDQSQDHGGSGSTIAAEIANGHTGFIPPPVRINPTPSPTPAPIAVATPTPDDSELKARRQAFFQALYSPSAIPDQRVDVPAIQQEPPIPEAPKAMPAEINQMGPDLPTPAPNPNALSTYIGEKDRWTLNSHLEAPKTPYVLQTGWVIPALLLSGMESQLPGEITAQVSQDVYDSPTGRFLLIPQGSRLVGEYANAIQYGQSRIFVAWQRIVFPPGRGLPSGATLDLGAMPGGDAEGEAGFHDLVDNHFLRLFGSALLMSAISGATALSQPQNSFNSAPTASSTLSAALGQQLGAATSALLEKNLSIPPTLKIRQGYSFNVVVVKDLVFDRPYAVPNY